MKRHERPRTWRGLAATIGIALVACMGVAAFQLFGMGDRAANPGPSPSGRPRPDGGSVADLMIDWADWRRVNPDIVGWIAIPGTGVSQPIVAATADDPDYYLDHDVYGNWNPYGAVYLDAGCRKGLLNSRNAVVYGHHMHDGSMFSEIAGYADLAWAREHQKVMVLVPGQRLEYRVRFAGIVDNAALPKQTAFADRASFEAWYAAGLANASAVLDASERPLRTLSLVTCSYRRFDDERTVAMCSLEQ